eukprot:scaffold20257_cov121-Isochrysis_galbana.AAC.2
MGKGHDAMMGWWVVVVVVGGSGSGRDVYLYLYLYLHLCTSAHALSQALLNLPGPLPAGPNKQASLSADFRFPIRTEDGGIAQLRRSALLVPECPPHLLSACNAAAE